MLSGIEDLAKAGVVHSYLSPYNILVYEGRPWFIDLSEAIRVDRLGYSHWQRLDAARKALRHGLERFAIISVNMAWTLTPKTMSCEPFPLGTDSG